MKACRPTLMSLAMAELLLSAAVECADPCPCTDTVGWRSAHGSPCTGYRRVDEAQRVWVNRTRCAEDGADVHCRWSCDPSCGPVQSSEDCATDINAATEVHPLMLYIGAPCVAISFAAATIRACCYHIKDKRVGASANVDTLLCRAGLSIVRFAHTVWRHERAHIWRSLLRSQWHNRHTCTRLAYDQHMRTAFLSIIQGYRCAADGDSASYSSNLDAAGAAARLPGLR